ncbi:hypothetical protein L1887_18729 [Cichorium endivia]|nr:hypothetical protein L1887_18729 [Cichorium endivia]
MVSSKEQSSIYDIKLSSVIPGFISRTRAPQELTAMDLAMKLHYVHFVYYFSTPAFDGLTMFQIKGTMIDWLGYAYIPCGRLRREDSGRPFIKCNDSGLRIIEARCHQCLDDWLKSKDDARHKFLVPNHVIGPDLTFSPLVMIQITKFRCGAISIGMSWSHVLGDAISAMNFIKLWTQVIVGNYPTKPLTMAQQKAQTCNIQSPNHSPDPLSIKRVGPVGDFWSTSNISKMETFSLFIPMSKLIQLQEKISQEKVDPKIPLFESICVVIWKCLGTIRHESGLKVVTVCKNDLKNRTKGIITNKNQTICVVKTNVSIAECNMMHLGSLMMNQAVDEGKKIEEAMESDDKLPDFVIYGANLTFVDLSNASFYDMEVTGQKPVYVSCVIDNIGDNGVVLVLPPPKGCSDGRIVNITLLENEVVELKKILKEDWCIA